MSNWIKGRQAVTGTSRRRFLGMLGVGIAGVAVVTGMLPWGRRKAPAEAMSEFPGPGSIFHPARDPRTDPRRGNRVLTGQDL